MNFMKSDYEQVQSTILAGIQDELVSPNVSRDSIEYSSDDPTSVISEPTECIKAKTSPKTSFLAKKRLQAYSTWNRFKLITKEDKEDGHLNEKPQRTAVRKHKKCLNPDDAAKAVIRDIEDLKKAGFGGPSLNSSAFTTSIPTEILPVDLFTPISLSKIQADKSPNTSLYADMDEDNLFKKREIKCRNIRKSQTHDKRSPSPKSYRLGSIDNQNSKEVLAYPSNWTEYKKLNLNPNKDSLLKAKLFKKPRSKDFSLKKYYNFESPSQPIEIFKCQPKSGDTLWIPFSHLRSTSTTPHILYSTNHHVTSSGFLTRNQLFSLVTLERKLIIEKLWQSPSKCQPNNKITTVKKWYPRNWKKFDNTEAKQLEKSVGLSFLQSYSDEDDEVLEEDSGESIKCEKLIREKEHSCSPSATPKKITDFKENETLESLYLSQNNFKEINDSIYLYHDRTPPLDEKVESEHFATDDTTSGSEDEYRKTKKELARLEEDLKSSSVNCQSDSFKISLKTSGKKIKEDKRKEKRKDDKKYLDKKYEVKNVKMKKKNKKKVKHESSEISDTSEDDTDKKNKKSKKKIRKKTLKNKSSKKAKKHKFKKKRNKRKKDKYETTSEDDSRDAESLCEDSLFNKKKKNTDIKPSKESKNIPSCSPRIRKSSVDITHEGYEDDIKFFTSRFDKEDSSKEKIKQKKGGNAKTTPIKNKTNINLEELNVYYDEDRFPAHLIEKKNPENKLEENEKSSKDKVIDGPEIGLKESQKNEVKIDLLKKNEEYLKEQDKLKEKRKISSENPFKGKYDISSKNKEIIEKEDNTTGSLESVESVISPKRKTSENNLETSAGVLGTENVFKTKLTTNILKTNEFNISHKKDILKDDDVISKNIQLKDDVIDSSVEKEKMIMNDFNKNEKSDMNIQPDWEQLKNKRKRHAQEKTGKRSERNSNEYEIYENVEMFPLERDLILTNIKKEKESSIIDINAVAKHDLKDEISVNKNDFDAPNTWEIDEENVTVEKRNYAFANLQKSLNLEIPLNIEHFTRRDIKIESDDFDISPEKVIKSSDSKRKRKSSEKKKMEVEYNEIEKEHNTDENIQKTKGCKEQEDIFDWCIQSPQKKRRWDIKSSDSSVSSPIIKTKKPFEIFDLETNVSSNDLSLENEYEEFLKAVTNKEAPSDNKCIQIASDNISNSSILIDIDKKDIREDNIIENISSITNLNEVVKPPVNSISLLDIPTVQIPLPPANPEELKPVPVPLPKLEAVFDINKPLINLSLSANVTQNITLSLATSATSISAPVTSSIDISKTSVEISTPVSKDTVVSMNDIPLPMSVTSCTHPTFNVSSINIPELKLTHPLTLSKSEPQEPCQQERHNISSSQIDTISNDIHSCDEDLEKNPVRQKIVFTALTLPTKKQLLNNSVLKLDDSDNDDQNMVEEIKRKKLEALIEDNKKEVQIEETNKPSIITEKKDILTKAKSPISSKPILKDEPVNKPSQHKQGRHEVSPRRKKESPVKRKDSSPKRRHSPRRRSPRRSPRRRSPINRRSPIRRKSPGRRKISPRRRRSISPRKRRSPSPRRKRSCSPKNRYSPRRNRSISPHRKRSVSPKIKSSRLSTPLKRSRSPRPSDRKHSPSPIPMSSPLDGLKRSVADSTISDDHLPQSTSHLDFNEPRKISFNLKNNINDYDSPKRISLDERINQVLGCKDTVDENIPKSISSTSYNYNNQQPHIYSEQYSCIQSQVTTPTMRNSSYNQNTRVPQSCYKQVGNMLQIVPNDDLEIDIPKPRPSYEEQPFHQYNFGNSSTNMDLKPQILQVGNMLQIVPSDVVPADMMPVPPPQSEVKSEQLEEPLVAGSYVSVEKPSAEAAMLQKIAERRAEREKRRQERERRRKEKEKRHREKERVRQAKLKIKTENMIKKALEMEQEELETGVSEDNPPQWPPLATVAHLGLKEAGKSILVTSSFRKFDELLKEEKKMKVVQFADGIKPGEGTSPSAGEELSSPPPPSKKKLPKEKRYKKLKFGKKSVKKKVKVKVIKKPPSPSEESDTDDNLPPPSPPPGSPPPHIFPPRIKIKPVNNVPAAYLTTIIQTAQQQQHQHQIQQQQHQIQQQQQHQIQPHVPHQQKLPPTQHQLQQPQQQYQSNLYCPPPINLLMAPPPPPQGLPPHLHSPHGSTHPAQSPSPHGSQPHYHTSLPPPPPPPAVIDHYSSSSSGQPGLQRHF